MKARVHDIRKRLDYFWHYSDEDVEYQLNKAIELMINMSEVMEELVERLEKLEK